MGAAIFCGKIAVELLGQEVQPDRPAVAWIPVTELDLGQVVAGQVVKTRFQVVNKGGRRLIIRQHTASCPCVSARTKPVILLPGETRYIAITLDSHDLEGPFQMEMDYTTSDPELPQFTLKLTVEVVPKNDRRTYAN